MRQWGARMATAHLAHIGRGIDCQKENEMKSKSKSGFSAAAQKQMPEGPWNGKMMEHEQPQMDGDNVLGSHQFKRGSVHPDSAGNGGLDGDGKGGGSHWGH
jgi:hypothetical protein